MLRLSPQTVVPAQAKRKLSLCEISGKVFPRNDVWTGVAKGNGKMVPGSSKKSEEISSQPSLPHKQQAITNAAKSYIGMPISSASQKGQPRKLSNSC